MKKSAWVFVMTAWLACEAQAGTAAAGTPGNPYFMNNGTLLIPTDGVRADVPACAATQAGRFAIDGSTAAGKVQVAGMLSAIAMGRKVAVWGTGARSVWPDTETVNFFQVVP